MANQEIRLKAELRTETGSGAAGRLRRSGSVPAAVNRIGGGTTLAKFDAHEFKGVLRKHANEQMLVTLDIDGNDVHALMREVQYDVITGYPIHADFGEISMSEKIHVQIPIRLLGEPEGVKVGGGIMQQILRVIDVQCLPADIVDNFEADVSHLKLNQSLFVRELALDAKYDVLTGKDIVVASVASPEADPSESAEVSAENAATPDVITKGKKEEDGAAAKAPAKK
ncbi:MAG: 50S ribosomal protein L25 [Kiritimatiellae bacterium]|nr:50S ribosomal protein L25 [Kiritimatiellia bacterium]